MMPMLSKLHKSCECQDVFALSFSGTACVRACVSATQACACLRQSRLVRSSCSYFFAVNVFAFIYSFTLFCSSFTVCSDIATRTHTQRTDHFQLVRFYSSEISTLWPFHFFLNAIIYLLFAVNALVLCMPINILIWII